ncbi:radical SAM/SPASM domain-containing protein [Clostridium algidicarnis]|uniref:radical SAM/SPASM domain-containing protein n=1 Tax=Clostridium algidicarnis TaxID=37659 RepID=UPI001C0C5949|nr:radical SAM protein [Clostridium algidicarnis]MBU3209533.1 SPASM domain-containing protein [Clostridium algidicarnis]MBU3227212.1 SPASM domain-containing protein [Clostridium algidicarnis]MBU3250736.1 SPASM domain-containing protein [Clostridium algidicarnis]
MKLKNFNINTDNEKVVHYNYGRYIILDLVTLDYIVVDKIRYNQLLEEYKSYLRNKDNIVPKEVKEDFLDSKQLVNIVLITGFDCNYECTYCCQNEYKSIKDKLNVDDLLKIKEFYNDYDSYFSTNTTIDKIDIMGGEPFLNSNVELINGVFEKFSNSKISFTTNGANIIAYKSIIENNKSNIEKVILSVDGEKKLHLKHRKTIKDEYYDNIWEGLEFLLGNDIEVHINTVYHPEDSNEYINFFDKLEKYGWLENKFSVSFTLDITKTDYNDEDNSYLNTVKDTFKNILDSDNRAQYIGQNFINYNISTMYNMIKYRDKIEPYKSCEVCSKPSYTFLPTGDVIFCIGSNNSKFKVGTYKPEITINKKSIKELNSRDIRTMSECSDCEHKYFCKGGCVAKALNNSSKLDASYCGRWKEENHKESLEDVLNLLIKEEIINNK